MATEAGYSDISTAGPYMSGAATDQRNNRHYPQNVAGHGIPSYKYVCYCSSDQDHTQHCTLLNNSMFHAFAQTWRTTMEQPAPRPEGGREPLIRYRNSISYVMEGEAQVRGRSSMEVDHSEQEQPHVSDTGSAPPSDQNGDDTMGVESAGKAWHGGHAQSGAPRPRAQEGPGGNSGEPRVTHECCNTSCLTGEYVPDEATGEKKAVSVGGRILRRIPGFSSDQDDLVRKEKVALMNQRAQEQFKGEEKSRVHKEALVKRDEELERKKEELERKKEELERKKEELERMKEELERKKEELERKDGEWKGAAANLQKEMKIMYDKQVASLTHEVMQYRGLAERYEGQLSALEQSNSKRAIGTGAHPDTHATPTNLMHAAFEVTGAALTFTKAFRTFLKQQNASETHPAVQAVPEGKSERYRKYAVESYICSRLFAGFENDSYLDSFEKYEQTPFFLLIQDPELRHKQYVRQYEELQKLGLGGVMGWLKTDEAKSGNNYFQQFCCRKLVSILVSLDGWFEEVDLAPGAPNILHQLAMNPKYSDKLLKPFVNLALVAYMLHHLAFQFHPPARIFRYAQGTPFDNAYMQSAVPLDDDAPVEECVVGHMVIPGFQDGATIVKCIVYLVPSPPKPRAWNFA